MILPAAFRRRYPAHYELDLSCDFSTFGPMNEVVWRAETQGMTPKSPRHHSRQGTSGWAIGVARPKTDRFRPAQREGPGNEDDGPATISLNRPHHAVYPKGTSA